MAGAGDRPGVLSVHPAVEDALDPAGLLDPGELFRRAHRGDLGVLGALARP